MRCLLDDPSDVATDSGVSENTTSDENSFNSDYIHSDDANGFEYSSESNLSSEEYSSESGDYLDNAHEDPEGRNVSKNDSEYDDVPDSDDTLDQSDNHTINSHNYESSPVYSADSDDCTPVYPDSDESSFNYDDSNSNNSDASNYHYENNGSSSDNDDSYNNYNQNSSTNDNDWDDECDVTNTSADVPSTSGMARKSTNSRRSLERTRSLEECSICFEIMLNDQQLITLPCTHNYHEACIQVRQDCPKCRKTVD